MPKKVVIEKQEIETPKPAYPDSLNFNCIDCNASFEWTGREQVYYKANNLVVPKRCYKCRAIKRAASNNTNMRIIDA